MIDIPPIYNLGKTPNPAENNPASGGGRSEKFNLALIAAVVILAASAGFYWFSGGGSDSLSKALILRSATATADSGNVSSSLYGSIVAVNPAGGIIVKAGEKQVIPEGSLRTIGVPTETAIQKIKPVEVDGEGNALSASFEDADFEDLLVGQDVVVQAAFDVDVSKEDNFDAVSVIVVVGDF